MSRIVERSKCNIELPESINQSMICSDWNEFSHSINASASHDPNDSTLRWRTGEESPPCSNASAATSASLLVSPTGIDAADDPTDLNIRQRQSLHVSKTVSFLNFLESCDSDWAITPHNDPQEYVGEEPVLPTIISEGRLERRQSDCSEFLDVTLLSDHEEASKRSRTMIESFSRSMNYLQAQELIELDIPNPPTDTGSDNAFTLSDESETEMRNAVTNIVRTLDVTNTDEQSTAQGSASEILPKAVGNVEVEEICEPVESINETAHERHQPDTKVAEVNPGEPEEPITIRRNASDQTAEVTEEQHDKPVEPAMVPVALLRVPTVSDDPINLTTARSRNRPNPAALGSVLPEKRYVPLDLTVSSRSSVFSLLGSGTLIRNVEADEGKTHPSKLTIVAGPTVEPHTVLSLDPDRSMKETTNDVSIVSPCDPLGNEHLTWHESSTSDLVATPTVSTAPDEPAKVPVTAVDSAPPPDPIKLDPITQDARYSRCNPRRKCVASPLAQKKVQFHVALPEKSNDVARDDLVEVSSRSSVFSLLGSGTLMRNVEADEGKTNPPELIIVAGPTVEPHTVLSLDPDRNIKETTNDVSIVSPCDPLGNLTWHESSTSDLVATPTVSTAPDEPAKVPVTAVDSAPPPDPIKLDPITQDTRYSRRNPRRKCVASPLTQKNVHFDVALPEKSINDARDELVEDRAASIPCYQTRWSSTPKSAANDPYDAANIIDDGESTFEQLFPDVEQFCENNPAAVEDADDDDSVEADRRAILKMAVQDFELNSPAEKKKKKKKNSKKKHSKEKRQGETEAQCRFMGRESLEGILSKVVEEQVFPDEEPGQESPTALNSSVDAAIASIIKLTRKEFELSSPPNQSKKHKHPKHQADCCLVNKETLVEVMRKFVTSTKDKFTKPAQKPPTAEKAVQAAVTLKDVSVETPQRFPTGKRRQKVSKQKVDPVVERVPTAKSRKKNSKQQSEAEEVALDECLPPETVDECGSDRRLRQTTLSQYASSNRQQRRKPDAAAPSDAPTGSDRKQPADPIQSKGVYRSHVSLTTNPSEEQSTIPESEMSIVCPNATIILNVAPSEHESFFRQMDSLQLSDDDDGEVPPTQHTDPAASRRARKYSCSVVRIIVSNNWQPTINDPDINLGEIRSTADNCEPSFTVIGPSFNDPDVFTEEFLAYIEQSLALNIERGTLPVLETAYDAPVELSSHYIGQLLIGCEYDDSPDELGTECIEKSRFDDDDDGFSDSDGEIDSGMDETIRPATYTVQHQHCSSTMGSQVPRLFSPEYSPIFYSGTPRYGAAERTPRSSTDSPVCKKRL